MEHRNNYDHNNSIEYQEYNFKNDYNSKNSNRIRINNQSKKKDSEKIVWFTRKYFVIQWEVIREASQHNGINDLQRVNIKGWIRFTRKRNHRGEANDRIWRTFTRLKDMIRQTKSHDRKDLTYPEGIWGIFNNKRLTKIQRKRDISTKLEENVYSLSCD